MISRGNKGGARLPGRQAGRFAIGLMLAVVSVAGAASERPRIALVIDDVGYQWVQDQRLLGLDSRVALAIIPDAPHATELAVRAARQGRAVLLHLPLGGLVHDNCERGLTCLGVDWSVERMRDQLEQQLERVPGAVGLNNHQGSQFTRNPEAVRRLLRALSQVEQTTAAPMIVLDSRTVADSQLERLARDAGFPALRRRVFIDHQDEPEAIRRAWQDLLDQARYHGSAVAIGHPRANTVDFLAKALPRLDQDGVTLVTIRELAADSSLAHGQVDKRRTAP